MIEPIETGTPSVSPWIVIDPWKSKFDGCVAGWLLEASDAGCSPCKALA
jgi:hypothetical protein